MNPVAIHTNGLTRHFGKVRALDSLTLDVPAGTVFGFLGPNGAGKTTTIRLLLGLLEPTSGRAEVLGFDTVRSGAEVRARTGALLEHAGLYERLSAEDNLDFYGRVWKLPAGERKARVRALLDQMGLWDRRRQPVRGWSRGMKQKLAVARAVLHRPAIVFLDEPTAGLDPVAAAALRDDLATLARSEGVTIFLTTHNLAEAEKLCDLLGVIRRGQLLALGSPEQLRAGGSAARVEIIGTGWSDSTVEAVRRRPDVAAAAMQDGRLLVTFNDGARAAPVVRMLVEGGAEIEEVRRSHSTLEDVFLSLVKEDE